MGRVKNKLDSDYRTLVQEIINYGTEKEDRTGTGTLALFGKTLRHNMADGFPLMTHKHISLKNIKNELMWFLNGDTNIKFLVDRGCNIWNGDAYKHYSYTEIPHDHKLDKQDFIKKIKTDDEFAKKWGELGPIYGKQWRNWDGIDQVQDLIDNLRTNPDSRRLMVNAWNVGEIGDAVLPPCHFGFQCFTQKLTYKERYEIWFRNNFETGLEYNPKNQIDFDDSYYVETPERKLSLMWSQRSVDTGLGLPYNIASYGLLLLMLADEVDMVPGELIGSLGDTHLYLNHVGPITEIFARVEKPLPKVILKKGIYAGYSEDDIELIDYDPHPKLDLPLSN